MLLLNIDFLFSFTDYIILFPIKWHIFCKQILAKSTIYDNIIIFPINNIKKHENIYNSIYEIITENYEIDKTVAYEDFIMIYTDKEFLFYLRNWLHLITLRVFIENCENINYYLDSSNVLYCNDYLIKCFDDNIVLFENKGFQNIVVYDYNYFEFSKEVNKIIHLQKM